MNSNLEEKRRELFELHKAKLGTDAPLMRRPVAAPAVAQKVSATKMREAEPRAPLTARSKITYVIIGITALIVVAELVFLASQAGWLG
ncbi:hypothetical protein [Dyadobacter sp. Leaf189]|uniref:hypothetical protein n=1 Tax=Dyadobacter sp. Leaf189 TaxID=1736295 RepID=UPI0006F3D3E5|nr:hypothetical protein [Dyadobacter sp. Leaf189]KQS33948.1 hypothetical protein ASG33_07915 [Dyadobacter sp. Leaf189]